MGEPTIRPCGDDNLAMGTKHALRLRADRAVNGDGTCCFKYFSWLCITFVLDCVGYSKPLRRRIQGQPVWSSSHLQWSIRFPAILAMSSVRLVCSVSTVIADRPKEWKRNVVSFLMTSFHLCPPTPVPPTIQ